MASLFNVKTQFIVLFLALFGFMAIAQTAEAKRFGGGKSFGFQKQVAPKNHNKTQDKKQTQAPQGQQAGAAGAAGAASGAAAKSGAAKWLGPLAGLAAGGLLAAMIFGDGFEGIQIMDILLFALIAFVLFKIFASLARNNARNNASYQTPENNPYQAEQQRSGYGQSHAAQQQYRESRNAADETPVEKVQAKTHSAYDPNHQGSIFGADLEDGIGQAHSNQAEFLDEIPSWFNEQEFVDGAKQHFVNLQNAWDNVDLAEIESYCTPELFSALQQELAGTNAGENQTVVDDLYAEVAAIAIDGEHLVVSVRFTGFIAENSSNAHAFNEVWHIRRLANDEGNWLVAGIQQAS